MDSCRLLDSPMRRIRIRFRYLEWESAADWGRPRSGDTSRQEDERKGEASAPPLSFPVKPTFPDPVTERVAARLSLPGEERGRPVGRC